MPLRVIAPVALIALWWPGKLAGIFDGAPFDSGADAIALGLVLPALFWLVPQALRDRRFQAIVVALVCWKIFSSASLAQDGFCVRVTMPGQAAAVKNWDARTDWHNAHPDCSAIVDRALVEERQFPIWLPFSFAAGGSAAINPNPNTVVAQLSMSGQVRFDEAGTLRLSTSPSVVARMTVDGRPRDPRGAQLTAGSHHVAIDATLLGENWVLAPLWNETNLFTAATVTASAASALDSIVRPFGRWIPFALVTLLLMICGAHAYAAVRASPLVPWIAASSFAAAAMSLFMPERRWHYALTLLFAACALRLPSRLHDIRGAFVVLAPAWLTLNVFDTYKDLGFGRVAAILPGNDWWMFQRFAYSIYMDGSWLHGGEDAFWFQPFYRWIAGALHLLFGQSHVGENYWDAVAVLILALFSFEVARITRGFRWGLAAAALVLVAFVSGPGYIFIGRGLSEISSAAFICLAALMVLRAREKQSLPLLVLASCAAVLGVWTRLNNFPMALAIVLFAWPLSVETGAVWRPRAWFAAAWRPALIAVPASLAFGMVLFALRTWYYTGHFSVFYGTQSGLLSIWQPGMSAGAVARAMVDSVLMVATTTDPPGYHNGAVPIMAGFAFALAAMTGMSIFARAPMPVVGFTLAAFSSALIARGNAYSGRFSVHVVAATVAVLICVVADVFERVAAYRFNRGTNLVSPWIGPTSPP